MNAMLKKANRMHEDEVERWVRAWEAFFDDAARYRERRLGAERERRVWEWTERLAALTDEEAAPVEAFLRRLAEEERATEPPERTAAWEAWADVCVPRIEAFLLHIARGDTPDLAHWPAGLTPPPDDPEDVIAKTAAAFDAATDEVELMAYAHALRGLCEFAYLHSLRD